MNLGKDGESLPIFTSHYTTITCPVSSSGASVWSDASSQVSDSASSTSGDSIWSDASSQSSDDTSISASDDSENDCYNNQSCDTVRDTYEKTAKLAITTHVKPRCLELPPQHGRNPRRTSAGPATRSGGPPSLVNQEDRKIKFVDNLVDSSVQIVEAIWPISSTPCRVEMGSRGVLPLRTFIQETLRRSRTSYYTLQVALYYLILIKPHVPKRDFTMEQSDNTLMSRSLQCGRRMFLAALILASKYLQDRNYSARAWSKISGLNTTEINQNEMTFLKAVKFRLHITEAVFQRWTDIVLKYTPNEGPDPDAPTKRATPEQAECWKSIILKLDPDLSNVAGIEPSATRPKLLKMAGSGSTESFLEPSYTFGSNSNESTPTTKYFAPNVLEPCPSSTITPGRPAPALGLLPTPRMTPQSIGFCTPAASATPYSSGKSSMFFAMAQASNACASSIQDKWPVHASSPLSCAFQRRSSLATSVSSVSSPESMVSDTSSRSSRSSSISSASSLMSAPIAHKLDVQARCRYAKRCNNERNLRIVMAPVAEGTPDLTPTTSPDSYTGPVGKEFLGLSLDTPLSKHQSVEYFSKEHSAARALQDLHNYPRSCNGGGLKRSRTESVGQSLQDNVRELLSKTSTPTSSCHGSAWSDTLVRDLKGSRKLNNITGDEYTQVAMPSPCNKSLGRKRMCCESSGGCRPELVSLPTMGGPGMWTGILN